MRRRRSRSPTRSPAPDAVRARRVAACNGACHRYMRQKPQLLHPLKPRRLFAWPHWREYRPGLRPCGPRRCRRPAAARLQLLHIAECNGDRPRYIPLHFRPWLPRSCWLRRRRRHARTRRHRVLREARQLLVAHRQVIHGAGNRHRRHLRVALDDALIGVEIGMPRVRAVLDRDPGRR